MVEPMAASPMAAVAASPMAAVAAAASALPATPTAPAAPITASAAPSASERGQHASAASEETDAALQTALRLSAADATRDEERRAAMLRDAQSREEEKLQLALRTSLARPSHHPVMTWHGMTWRR